MWSLQEIQKRRKSRKKRKVISRLPRPPSCMSHHTEQTRIHTVMNCVSGLHSWKSVRLLALQTCDHTAHSTLHLFFLLILYNFPYWMRLHIISCLLFPLRSGMYNYLFNRPQLSRYMLYIKLSIIMISSPSHFVITIPMWQKGQTQWHSLIN